MRDGRAGRPTNELLRLVGGRLGRGQAREGEEGPPTSCKDSLVVDRAWDGQGKPPNESNDLLVVVWAGTSEGEAGRPTNELLRLVGGCLGLGRAREGCGCSPTSPYGSLVVVWAGDEQGRGENPPNKSQWLVGGCMAKDERGRGEETHQRVFMTRWWSFGPGTSEGGGRGLTNKSNYSLVVVWAGMSKGEAG